MSAFVCHSLSGIVVIHMTQRRTSVIVTCLDYFSLDYPFWKLSVWILPVWSFTVWDIFCWDYLPFGVALFLEVYRLEDFSLDYLLSLDCLVSCLHFHHLDSCFCNKLLSPYLLWRAHLHQLPLLQNTGPQHDHATSPEHQHLRGSFRRTCHSASSPAHRTVYSTICTIYPCYQSHGSTSTLLWFGRGVQRVLPPMRSLSADVSSSVLHG